MNVYSGVCIVLLTIAVIVCLFWMIRCIIDSIRDSFKEPYKPDVLYDLKTRQEMIKTEWKCKYCESYSVEDNTCRCYPKQYDISTQKWRFTPVLEDDWCGKGYFTKKELKKGK